MAIINTINEAISDAVDKTDVVYTSLIGSEEFTPESVIDESSDYNCGGMANELEYLRAVSDYYVQSFDLDIAEEENLEDLITAFIDLPRRNRAEEDTVYRRRYRALTNAKVNNRRITKWAILDAIREFGLTTDQIQFVERFDTTNLYFEIRIEGAADYETAIFLDNQDSGFIDQNFVGGSGVGEVISYLGSVISRIKAAGVDFDVVFIYAQTPILKTVDAFLGVIQMYMPVDSVIKASSTVTININATVV